ncbi:Di-copper centre-containing protein [Aspergillus heteromorphus CBS 117.55]|uniref:Di-copper centre-containing protein n=1 Tax=Aspergillus heteromorphus CBS 117.55 TaxID=1448321 RepID=A0A317WW28_9EURO|nr:Di-copper centre-containing protein [Aspergillus heteromorphus CBS 117.55]PWY88510.1 Di-copper centre-containing protein [Aspergillus heteromorphus CBS 117.55]
MVLKTLLALGLLALQACAIPTASTTDSDSSSAVAAAAAQISHLASHAYNETIANLPSSGPCTRETLRIRRNWRAFSTPEKKAYIDSVLCLQSRPARTPSELAPGAKTRYDDFVATHINQTLEIHYTGTFLAWHRYFIYRFEQSLREECGYTGDYPYWDWGADASSMETSPVFDGTATSMSGNGAPIANEPPISLFLGNYPAIVLPAGTGGGCVTSGPFRNYTLNLGPAALSLPGANSTFSAANPLAHNPRCLKRDLTTAILSRYNTYPQILSLITDSPDVWTFEMTMQGVPGSGSIGVHGGGHYAMGGDPGRDVFVSPGDVAFWHHHGMIDRVWWIWQSLDRQSREKEISGTGTFMNEPPSANTTLESVVDVGYVRAGETRRMSELMSTSGGLFCYAYL